MTVSIGGRCPRAGEFGIAVSSSPPAVAARCGARAGGGGVVGSQGLAAGGEAGPVHPAGMVVVRDQPWPVHDHG